jgi:hypothetical protein
MSDVVSSETIIKAKEIVNRIQELVNKNPDNQTEFITQGVVELTNLIAQEIIAKVVKETIEEVLKNCTIQQVDSVTSKIINE